MVSRLSSGAMISASFRVVAKTSIVAIEQKGKESEEAVMLDDLTTLLGGGLG